MKNGRYKNKGDTRWYLNDQLHREDGPAIIFRDASAAWFIEGKCHREDGPAIELKDGTKQWWISGIQLSEEEFNQWLMKKKLNDKLNEQLKSKPTQKRSKI